MANDSIFRNESENLKDDELMSPPLRIQQVAVLDDEVAEGGYFTIPPIQTVASTKSVQNFTVCRKGYGQIEFKVPVDLSDIPSLSILREIVEIERGKVNVYPNKAKRPPVGTGFNVPAKVSLEKLWHPPEVDPEEYLAQLQSTPDTNFISYDAETGLWTYEVEHF
jgi:nuclear pore complex protein Nup98-Nup96